MDICEQLCCNTLGAFFKEPAKGVAEEEALCRCHSIYFLPFLVSVCLLKGIETYEYATKVGEVFAEGSLAIDMQGINRYHFIELLHQHIGTFYKLGSICGRPPTGEVAVLIRFSALIIKAMGDLMADSRGCGIAIYERIIEIGIFIAGYSHHGCGQHNLVIRLVVVGIVSLWCHGPFIAVYRLAQLAHFVVIPPLVGTHHVEGIGATVYFE